jgi:hypothetical protein
LWGLRGLWGLWRLWAGDDDTNTGGMMVDV